MSDMNAENEFLDRCVKHGCRAKSITVELEMREGSHNFPNALCKAHARCPWKLGTIENPTVIQK